MSGCSGRSICLAWNPRCISQTATTTAAATTAMKSVFHTSRVTRTNATSTIALAIDTGTLRPARPWSLAGALVVIDVRGPAGVERSDLEQLGLLVLEQVVDGVRVLLGRGVETLLGTRHVVLPDLVVLLHLLQLLLRVTPEVADGDAALLGLVARDLDVLLAPLLGQLREDATDQLAVVGGGHAEVGVADRPLDVPDRAHVVRRHEDHAGVLGGERREALQRSRRAVVVDHDLAEHRGVGAAGPDSRELLAGRLDGLVHLAVGLVEDVVDHGVFPSDGGARASQR